MGIRLTALPLGAAAAVPILPVLATGTGIAPTGVTGRSPEEAGESPVRDRRIRRVAIAGALLAVPQFGVMALFVVFLH